MSWKRARVEVNAIIFGGTRAYKLSNKFDNIARRPKQKPIQELR